MSVNATKPFSGMHFDKRADARTNFLPPATPGKDAVMPTSSSSVMLLFLAGDVGAKIVGGLGLADTANVVELAFNGEERYRFDVLWPHQFAIDFPGAERQMKFLKHCFDCFQVILRRPVEYRI